MITYIKELFFGKRTYTHMQGSWFVDKRSFNRLTSKS